MEGRSCRSKGEVARGTACGGGGDGWRGARVERRCDVVRSDDVMRRREPDAFQLATRVVSQIDSHLLPQLRHGHSGTLPLAAWASPATEQGLDATFGGGCVACCARFATKVALDESFARACGAFRAKAATRVPRDAASEGGSVATTSGWFGGGALALSPPRPRPRPRYIRAMSLAVADWMSGCSLARTSQSRAGVFTAARKMAPPQKETRKASRQRRS
jgi:hypothetical protein